jgi:HD-GYP domain-containing protein (c-di-GMP phosphodiesterase class II)
MPSISTTLLESRSLRLEPGTRVKTGNIWDVLDRFVRGLENAESLSTQLHCVLEAIRASLQADAVFAYSNKPAVPGELMSGKPLSASWRRRFMTHNLETLSGPHESYRYVSEEPGPVDSALMPHSALMVQFAKSKPLWIVAMSFDRQHRFCKDDLKIMLLIRRIFQDHGRQTRTQGKLTDAMLGVVRGLNEAISAKSPFTSGHSERVARMAVCLGRQMKLSPAVLSDLYLAGLLHDVGKIGIRDDVLQKQGPLTEEEQAHVRQHPLIGDTIVAKINNLAHLRPGVRNHHERFDGGGYPDGLAGHAIPLLARILSVADACDAMMSPRPYRPGLATEQVDVRMNAGAGSQWDPCLIEHFMACRRELYGIYNKGIGDSVVYAVEETIRSKLAD